MATRDPFARLPAILVVRLVAKRCPSGGGGGKPPFPTHDIEELLQGLRPALNCRIENMSELSALRGQKRGSPPARLHART
jgi:hypothetical protein